MNYNNQLRYSKYASMSDFTISLHRWVWCTIYQSTGTHFTEGWTHWWTNETTERERPKRRGKREVFDRRHYKKMCSHVRNWVRKFSDKNWELRGVKLKKGNPTFIHITSCTAVSNLGPTCANYRAKLLLQFLDKFQNLSLIVNLTTPLRWPKQQRNHHTLIQFINWLMNSCILYDDWSLVITGDIRFLNLNHKKYLHQGFLGYFFLHRSLCWPTDLDKL